MKKIGLQVDFDGLRSRIAGDYNQLVTYLRRMIREEELKGTEWTIEEIQKKLEEMRFGIGMLLLIQDEKDGFQSLDDEIDHLEEAELGK